MAETASDDKSTFWKILRRLGLLGGALAFVTSAFAFWDTACERVPQLARIVATCKAPHSALPPKTEPSTGQDRAHAERVAAAHKLELEKAKREALEIALKAIGSPKQETPKGSRAEPRPSVADPRAALTRLTAAQVISAGEGGVKLGLGEFVVETAEMSMLATANSQALSIALFARSSGGPALVLPYSGSSSTEVNELRGQPCFVFVPGSDKPPTLAELRNHLLRGRVDAPKCSAKIVVLSERGRPVRVVSIENVRIK